MLKRGDSQTNRHPVFITRVSVTSLYCNRLMIYASMTVQIDPWNVQRRQRDIYSCWYTSSLHRAGWHNRNAATEAINVTNAWIFGAHTSSVFPLHERASIPHKVCSYVHIQRGLCSSTLVLSYVFLLFISHRREKKGPAELYCQQQLIRADMK